MILKFLNGPEKFQGLSKNMPQGRVVRETVNANLGLKVNRGNDFSCIKELSIAYMFCVVWDYSRSKLKGKKCKQNSLLKSYKNEIEILANPGLR